MGLILCMAYIGVLPLVSSVLGIMASTEYFLGEASSLEKTLNAVRLLHDVHVHQNDSGTSVKKS